MVSHQKPHLFCTHTSLDSPRQSCHISTQQIDKKVYSTSLKGLHLKKSTFNTCSVQLLSYHLPCAAHLAEAGQEHTTDSLAAQNNKTLLQQYGLHRHFKQKNSDMIKT